MLKVNVIDHSGNLIHDLFKAPTVEDAQKWIAENQANGSFTNCTFIFQDITAEIAAKAVDDAAVDQARLTLKHLKKTDLVDVASLADAVMKLVKFARADK